MFSDQKKHQSFDWRFESLSVVSKFPSVLIIEKLGIKMYRLHHEQKRNLQHFFVFYPALLSKQSTKHQHYWFEVPIVLVQTTYVIGSKYQYY